MSVPIHALVGGVRVLGALKAVARGQAPKLLAVYRDDLERAEAGECPLCQAVVRHPPLSNH
jgi:hypothetical protein